MGSDYSYLSIGLPDMGREIPGDFMGGGREGKVGGGGRDLSRVECH